MKLSTSNFVFKSQRILRSKEERIVYGCFEESSCESNELNLLFMLMTIIYMLLLCLSQSVAFNSHFLVVLLSCLEMNRNELNRSKVNSFELELEFKFEVDLGSESEFEVLNLNLNANLIPILIVSIFEILC